LDSLIDAEATFESNFSLIASILDCCLLKSESISSLLSLIFFSEIDAEFVVKPELIPSLPTLPITPDDSFCCSNGLS